MWTSLLSIICLAGFSSAHFILHWPYTAGFDDDLEATSPCGSFKPEVNSSSPNIQVDRFAIFIQNVHPVGEWSFRGTLDLKPPYKFTEIVPIVNTTGIGDFCLDYMTVPSHWAGNPGIIQVVDNSPDGILFQCAPVNFVSGSNNTLGPACANATNFDAKWTNLEFFKGENGGAETTTSKGNTMTATAASSSSTGAAAIATGLGSLVGGLGLLAAGLL